MRTLSWSGSQRIWSLSQEHEVGKHTHTLQTILYTLCTRVLQSGKETNPVKVQCICLHQGLRSKEWTDVKKTSKQTHLQDPFAFLQGFEERFVGVGRRGAGSARPQQFFEGGFGLPRVRKLDRYQLAVQQGVQLEALKKSKLGLNPFRKRGEKNHTRCASLNTGCWLFIYFLKRFWTTLHDVRSELAVSARARNLWLTLAVSDRLERHRGVCFREVLDICTVWWVITFWTVSVEIRALQSAG